ncbi:DUF3939 domain-containing protein [Desertibacillus haloalkaliphilus]|uniref:DUF3939 domain-containing protein n=1 Tax=Desertibacillus haloalkaliphilus TaxID=1328930 RepID=UPI001C268230|nr:DUF3939 domain-containing protein [Desertibacillus haloalkaliphilus]MBU8908859.1 DUF3939 domain-containing protein [Desertibacillus haloalkaliphilus]
MFFKKKKKAKEEYPVVDVSIDDIRQAITTCANELPMGVSLRSFINDDCSINYELLKPFLKAIPERTYYMSKETFEVFESPDLPRTIDQVQRAVDQYIQETKQLPVIPGNPDNKISYYMIRNYLKEEPEFELYLEVKDHLVTHRRPES